MDGKENNNRYAPKISNSKPGILHQSDKKCNLTVSSGTADIQNLSRNKQDSDDHSSDKPDDADVSSIKPDIYVGYSKKSDSIDILRDYSEILVINGKVDTPEKLSDIQANSVLPSGKFSSYVKSSNTSQDPNLPTEIVVTSSNKPGSCDFSCDKPWSENFPSRKKRRSDFFSENIWGSNFSTDNPVSCEFSSDKTWSGYFPSDKSQSPDNSSENNWGEGFSSGKPETCDLSRDKTWVADFSSGKSEFSSLTSIMPMPDSHDLLNDKPDDSKYSNSSLKNPDTSRDMLGTTNEVGIGSYWLLIGKSSSSNKEIEESMSTNVSPAEQVYDEVSNVCLENPETPSKRFGSTDNRVNVTSVIPSYIIEKSRILGNDPKNCKTEKEINDIHNFSYSNSISPDYKSLESFDNGSELIIADGTWKIEKCQKSDVCVLKPSEEDTQYKFKCIYFNKGTKLDDLFKNRTHDELNVSQEEILECIDSMKEDQMNFIEDPIKSIDQSGFLEDRMTTTMKRTDVDLDTENSALIQNNSKEQIDRVVEKLLNEVFCTITKNEKNTNVTHYNIKTYEREIIENVKFDEAESKGLYDDHINSNKLVGNFKNANNCENIGSQVQDISGYLSSTDPLNNSVTETTKHRKQMEKSSIQQKLINCVKFVWGSIFSVVLGVFSSFLSKTKSLISTECSTARNSPETVSDNQEFQLGTNANKIPSTSNADKKAVSSESVNIKTRITNFSTLFQHLSATVGTDMTAERAMKDINSQVVMDIYNGFHELRIVDYGSLDLMSNCISGCIVTLQRTLAQSSPIVQKASVLMKKKTHTLEEMRKLNEDLKDLTSDAEVHFHNIDRALTGLEDFTDDFMYYKNGISKELVEFLLEDFPEIFK